MPRQLRADIPRRCICKDGHHCTRATAYAAHGFICWPCRQGTHSLEAKLDTILVKYGDRKTRRRANAAAKRQGHDSD